MRDWLNELLIRCWMWIHIHGHRLSVFAGQQHKHLIFSRSARQIERMERSRGLL